MENLVKRPHKTSISAGLSLALLLWGAAADAQSKPNPPTTSFASEPPGAEVRIDGVRRGNTSLELNQTELPPGKHTVLFQRHGFVDEARVIEVRLGQSLAVPRVVLKHLPQLEVVDRDGSSQGALLMIDTLAVGTLPMKDIVVAEGRHRLRVQKAGYGNWEFEGDFVAGSTYAQVVELERLVGKLQIKADWHVQPRGLVVYLDPGSNGYEKGKPLGQTPLETIEVPAGKHTVTVWLNGQLVHATQVDVRAGEETQVLYPIGDSYTRPTTYHTLAPAERLHSWCEAGELEECINAGYAWLHQESVPNVPKAMDAYNKACELGDPDGCFRARYLRKRHWLTDYDKPFPGSENWPTDIQWYEVLPSIHGLKDPTRFKGRSTRQDPPNYIDVGTMIRVGIAPSVPTYTSVMAEADVSSWEVKGPPSPFGPLLLLGLTYETASIETLNRQNKYRLHSLDVSFGIGYSIRPSRPTPLEIRVGILFDFSVVNNSYAYGGVGLGAWGGLAYRIGRHRFEAGSFVSGVPGHEQPSMDAKTPGTFISFDAAAVPYLRYTYLRSW